MFDEVVMSDHALERSDGGDEARVTVPESVLKRAVEQNKGMRYYDAKKDSHHQVYNKTVIIFDVQDDGRRAVIVTCYRLTGRGQNRYKDDRYEPV